MKALRNIPTASPVVLGIARTAEPFVAVAGRVTSPTQATVLVETPV